MKHPTLRSIRPLVAILAASFFSNSLLAIPVRVLAWDRDIASRPLAIGDSKGTTKIEGMHPTQRTEVYQVTAGETPPAIVALDKKGTDGKLLSTPIKIPTSTKNPLLIILPDEKAPSGVRIFVLEDDTAGFSWGSTRFINATPKELVFVSEKKGTALPPSWNPVQIDPGGDTRNREVKIFYRDQPEKAVYSALWEQSSDVRTLVFMVPSEDPRLGPVGIKMIAEDRRIIKAADEASKKSQKP
jgi:hypothetical protein